jgi:hypothetical protein
MRLDEILNDVVDSFTGRGHRSDNEEVQSSRNDPFGDPADYAQSGYPGGLQSASRDPFGDPADLQVADSSQDPYGDPADQYNGQQVADSSQDPYGDPADEDQHAHRGGGLLGRLFGG